MRLVALLALAVLGAGCSVAPPPDPNDPRDVTVIQAEVLRRNLKWASDAANERVAKGEITEEQARELVKREADRLIQSVKLEKVPMDQAWEYGEVFRAAKRWKEAEVILRVAAENATTEDRRVNDTLRLAQAQAQLGRVKEAISTARRVFDAKEPDRAPILPAVLLEITPAAEGKGEDIELAKLIEEAIDLHEQTLVDPASTAGKAFMAAKRHHIGNAWTKIMDLYRNAGRPDLLEAAARRARDSSSSRVRV